MAGPLTVETIVAFESLPFGANGSRKAPAQYLVALLNSSVVPVDLSEPG